MKYKQERKYLWTAIICMTLIFSSMFVYILLRDTTLHIEKEVCYNETRPHSTFYIPANDYSVIGSDEGNRWEIINYRINDIEIERDLRAGKEITILDFNKSLVGYDKFKSPFGFYNRNRYYDAQIRVYDNPVKKVCNIEKIPLNIGDIE